MLLLKSFIMFMEIDNMLAKKVVEAFGYKWDDEWDDTDDLKDIVDTMISCGETKKDIYKIIKKVKGRVI
jgi:hypothetical protein